MNDTNERIEKKAKQIVNIARIFSLTFNKKKIQESINELPPIERDIILDTIDSQIMSGFHCFINNVNVTMNYEYVLSKIILK